MLSPVAVERLKRIVNARFIDDPGQDLLEYALLVALIAVVAVASVGALGTVVHTIFWNNIATNF
jgi:Flp pilus assembly pilin Flp